jgi:hypothetical protein
MTRRKKPRLLLGACLTTGALVLLGGLAFAKLSSVQLTSPRSGTIVKGSMLIQAAVTTPKVSFVILGVDGQGVHSTNTPPYSYTVDTTELADGPHSVYAEVYGQGGLLARTPTTAIVVKNNAPTAPIAVKKNVAKPARPAQQTTTPQVKLPVPATPALNSRIDARSTSTGMAMIIAAEPKLSLPAVSLPKQSDVIAENKTALHSFVAAEPHPQAPSAISALPQPEISGAKIASLPNAVSVNGIQLDLGNLLREYDGSFDVGFRKTMTVAGWKVVWNEATNTARATANGRILEVIENQDYVLIDGRRIALSRAVTRVNDHLMIALRPLCQAAGISLKWDAKTCTACLSTVTVQANATVLSTAPIAATATVPAQLAPVKLE